MKNLIVKNKSSFFLKYFLLVAPFALVYIYLNFQEGPTPFGIAGDYIEDIIVIFFGALVLSFIVMLFPSLIHFMYQSKDIDKANKYFKKTYMVVFLFFVYIVLAKIQLIFGYSSFYILIVIAIFYSILKNMK